MADVARRNLAPFDNAEVRTARLEDGNVERAIYGLVACARAWGWLDPNTRVQRFADALYAHGTAAIIDNHQIVVDEHLAFFVRVQEVYERFTPGMSHQGDFTRVETLPPHVFVRSSRFEDLVQIKHEWEWTLPTDRYLGLMSTHSNHATLDTDTRARLHDGIAKLIETEFGGRVTENYVAVADLGRSV